MVVRLMPVMLVLALSVSEAKRKATMATTPATAPIQCRPMA